MEESEFGELPFGNAIATTSTSEHKRKPSIVVSSPKRNPPSAVGHGDDDDESYFKSMTCATLLCEPSHHQRQPSDIVQKRVIRRKDSNIFWSSADDDDDGDDESTVEPPDLLKGFGGGWSWDRCGSEVKKTTDINEIKSMTDKERTELEKRHWHKQYLQQQVQRLLQEQRGEHRSEDDFVYSGSDTEEDPIDVVGVLDQAGKDPMYQDDSAKLPKPTTASSNWQEDAFRAVVETKGEETLAIADDEFNSPGPRLRVVSFDDESAKASVKLRGNRIDSTIRDEEGFPLSSRLLSIFEAKVDPPKRPTMSPIPLRRYSNNSSVGHDQKDKHTEAFDMAPLYSEGLVDKLDNEDTKQRVPFDVPNSQKLNWGDSMGNQNKDDAKVPPRGAEASLWAGGRYVSDGLGLSGSYEKIPDLSWVEEDPYELKEVKITVSNVGDGKPLDKVAINDKSLLDGSVVEDSKWEDTTDTDSTSGVSSVSTTALSVTLQPGDMIYSCFGVDTLVRELDKYIDTLDQYADRSVDSNLYDDPYYRMLIEEEDNSV